MLWNSPTLESVPELTGFQYSDFRELLPALSCTVKTNNPQTAEFRDGPKWWNFKALMEQRLPASLPGCWIG